MFLSDDAGAWCYGMRKSDLDFGGNFGGVNFGEGEVTLLLQALFIDAHKARAFSVNLEAERRSSIQRSICWNYP